MGGKNGKRKADDVEDDKKSREADDENTRTDALPMSGAYDWTDRQNVSSKRGATDG